jgi:hypothetical protein
VICRRAAEVITRSLDEPLTLRVRVALGVHTLFCSPCRRFRRQMTRLHVTFEATATTDPPQHPHPTEDGLSAAARERITSALSRADESS